MPRKAAPYFAVSYGHQINSPLPWPSEAHTKPGPSAAQTPTKTGTDMILRGPSLPSDTVLPSP